MFPKFISNLKAFVQFAVPGAYDDSISLYDLVSKILAKLNETINGLNLTINELDNFEAKVEEQFNNLGEQMKPIVIEQLQKWLEDGTLADIINVAIFNGKVDKDFQHLHIFINPFKRIYCFLMTFTNGEHWLFDFGDTTSAPSIVSQLQTMGITKIDGLVLSHYHYDHAGGLETIAKTIDIRNAPIYLPPTPNWSAQPSLNTNVLPYYQSIQTCITTYGLVVTIPTEGQKVKISDKDEKLVFYNTNHTTYYTVSETDFDYNNCSLVCYSYIGEKSIGFYGDIGNMAQTAMAPTIPSVTLCIEPHHGSDLWVNESFYSAIHPEKEIIANGDGWNTDNSNLIGYNSADAGWCKNRGIPIFAQNSNAKSMDFYLSAYDDYTFSPETDVFTGKRFYSSFGETGLFFQWANRGNITMKDIISRMEKNSVFTGYCPNSGYALKNAFGGFFPASNSVYFMITGMEGSAYATQTTGPNLNERRGQILAINASQANTALAMGTLWGEYDYNGTTLSINWKPIQGTYHFHGYGSTTSNMIGETTCGMATTYNPTGTYSYNPETGEITINNSAEYVIRINIVSSETGGPAKENIQLNRNGTYVTRVGVVKDSEVRTSGAIIHQMPLVGGDKLTFTLSAASTGGYTYNIEIDYLTTYDNFTQHYTE